MVFGGAFFTTFLSIYLNSDGYTKGEIGIIQSAFFLGILVGAFQMENLIKRVGHIQALAVFGSLATSSTLLQALYQTFFGWIFLRFLIGLSLAALYIVIESWMLDHSTVKTRGVILSLYMISVYVAQSASQQILSFVEIQSYTPFLISALFTSLSVIPVGLSTSRLTIPSHFETLGFANIMRVSPFGVAGCFVSGLILSALYTFLPIFSVSQGIPSAHLMSITIAGGVILQLPIGKFSDYFERRRVLLFTIMISLLLSFTAFFYEGNSSTGIYVLCFLMGGFLFVLYPLCITQVCDHLDHSHIITATAFLLIAYGLGSVFGPVLSSITIDAFGINALFLYFTALLGVLGAIGAYSMILRPVVPLDEQTEFLPLTSVTPVTYEMDPRGESTDEEQESDSR